MSKHEDHPTNFVERCGYARIVQLSKMVEPAITERILTFRAYVRLHGNH